jgi:hypothetical protein
VQIEPDENGWETENGWGEQNYTEGIGRGCSTARRLWLRWSPAPSPSRRQLLPRPAQFQRDFNHEYLLRENPRKNLSNKAIYVA